MILYAVWKGRITQVYAEKQRTDFRILDENAYLIQQKGSWSVRLPYTLKRFRKPGDTKNIMHVISRADGSYADLYFIPCDENWKRFDRLQPQNHVITFGSDDHDDLCYSSEYIEGSCFEIDLSEHHIHAKTEVPVVLNQRIIGSDAYYRDGDEFSCFGCRIILHSDFIMVNRMPSLSHNMKPFVPVSVSEHRPPTKRILQYRRVPFSMPIDSITIRMDAPSPMRETGGRSLLFSIGPGIMMSGASLCSGLLSMYLGYGNGREIVEMLPMVMLPGIMMVSTLLWTPLQRFSDSRQAKKEKAARRKEYDRYLCSVMDRIDDMREHYQNAVEELFPDSKSAVHRYSNQKTLMMLECDQLYVRLGTSMNILHTELTNAKDHYDSDEEIENMKKKFFKEAQRQVRVPFLISLGDYRKIVIDRSVMYVAADLMMQIAMRYSPDQVGIAIVCDLQLSEENRWMLDLPHLFNQYDIRLLADEEHEIRDVLTLCREDPRRIVMFNLIGAQLESDAFDAEICFASASAQIKADLRIIPGKEQWRFEDFLKSDGYSVRPDHFDPDIIRFASRLPSVSGSHQTAGAFSFLEMHGVMDEKQLQIQERWNTGDINSSVASLIGCDNEGKDIILDLNEKRDGPHGLIAGTTGSGKSELILTMILSLAMNYSPADLQFILIDFKGGSSLNSLTNENNALPHVTGTLSNLDEEDIQRVLVQFAIECRKRESLLKSMSTKTGMPVMNVSDYRRLHKTHPAMEYIPELVIIVDEFAELKKEQPEFLNELISIARIGRSLGIHLILSTQKPSGVVTDQIWSNAKFKICLKVSEKQDSSEMIHRPDAAAIRDPGCFYLLADERLVYGRSGYVQSRSRLSDSCTAVYDTSHKLIASSTQLLEKAEPEINRIIAEIRKAYCLMEPVSPLWNAPISCVSQEQISEPWAYGIVDDYRHNRNLPLKLMPQSVHAFVSMDQTERKNLTKAMVMRILECCDMNDDIVLIDDLDAFDQIDWIRTNRIMDVLPSADEERCANLYRLIEERRNPEGGLFLIINDLNAHYETDENNRLKLMKCARTCENRKLTIVLMSSNSAIFSFRETGYLKYRAILKGAAAQDIQAFLETGTKVSVSKKHHGVMNDHFLLDFCVFECTDEMLNEVISNAAAGEIRQRSCLPHMPEVIDSSLCDLPGIALGIRKKDYQWAVLKDQMRLCIVSADPDDSAAFEKVLVNQGCQIAHEKNTDARIRSVSVDQAGDFDSYANRDTCYLFFNDAFRMQYRVHSRIAWKENEAVLYFRNRTEVIRPAEK